jgi:hypothetical protein
MYSLQPSQEMFPCSHVSTKLSASQVAHCPVTINCELKKCRKICSSPDLRTYGARSIRDIPQLVTLCQPFCLRVASSTSSMDNMQQMAQESVKSNSGDNLTCIGNDIANLAPRSS